VPANLDDSLTEDVLLAAGWGAVDPRREAPVDLWLDPPEVTNRIDDPRLMEVTDDLRRRLLDWMVRTGDPLLDGPRRQQRAPSSTRSTRSLPENPPHRRRITASRSPVAPGTRPIPRTDRVQARH
jgi:hypothetical protein